MLQYNQDMTKLNAKQLRVSKPNEKILIRKTKHKYKNSYKNTHIIVPQNKICTWYKWPAGRNQSSKKNTGFRYKHLLIPQIIPCDKLTLNALGLLQAEMTKHTKRSSSIIFTNSDPNLINTVINFFKRFGIQENEWSWNISFNFKLKSFETSRETKQREDKALSFWLENAKIESSRKRKKSLLYTGNKSTKSFDEGTMTNGSLIICYSNIILYQVVLNILNRINDLLFESPTTPIGGTKQSGFGKHFSRYGLLEFVNIKCVITNRFPKFQQTIKKVKNLLV